MLKETSKKEALNAALEGKSVLMLCRIPCQGEPDDMIVVDLTASVKSLTDKENAKFLVDIEDKEETKDEKKDEQEKAAPAMKADGKKKVGRKPVDPGKVVALKDAGWDNNMIADELSCSVATVKKYLRIYNAREPQPQN